MTGNTAELGGRDPNKAIGPLFNQIIAACPAWSYDVSVPAGTELEFKFIKKNGTAVTREGGANHSYTTSASGVGTVVVDWQPQVLRGSGSAKVRPGGSPGWSLPCLAKARVSYVFCRFARNVCFLFVQPCVTMNGSVL